MYYPVEIQITPLTNVRRERVLPTPGKILVDVGDQVEPTQAVARTNLPGDLQNLPVAQLLNVSASQAKRYLTVKPNDEVKSGQIIAKRGRLLPRTVKSPIDGEVRAIGAGWVLIEAPSTTFELYAYISGTVTQVVEPYGLVVETTGAVIQGAWGANGESFGVLKRMVESSEEPLKAQAIDPSCHGLILVGGSGLEDGVIEQARELQVRGIVVGGLNPKMIPQLEQAPFPIIVTEGIGSVPMSKPIFQLLKDNDGREAAISGRTRTRWDVLRPEIVIPLPAGEIPPARSQPGEPLAVGMRVRVVREPHLGAVGTVIDLPPYFRQIETGAKVKGAQVNLNQEEVVFVPLANLEILR